MVEFRKERGRPGRDEDPAPSVRKSLFVPILINQAIERIAQVKGISHHAAMREALAEYVERHDGVKE